MIPDRWHNPYRPGSYRTERRERIVLWGIWLAAAVAVSYGIVIGVLAWIGR